MRSQLPTAAAPGTLRFVTATRSSQQTFEREALLCRSLAQVAQFSPLALHAFTDNSRPLPDLYNEVIESADASDTLVFVHDDVWIDDWMVALRLQEALQNFDVIGVAGNRRRQAGQVSWNRVGENHAWDNGFLSGAIVHGQQQGQGHFNFFGPLPQAVKLLDGVFLAARAGTLQRSAVRFDPQFAFDFYDADFCRSCEQAGLRMGTWGIALTHASKGEMSATFEAAYLAYLNKGGS